VALGAWYLSNGYLHRVKRLLKLSILAGPLLLTGCIGSKSTDEDQGDALDSALIIPREDLMTVNELTSSTGKTWTVRQTPMLDSGLVNVQIIAKGFTGGDLPVDFGEADPVLYVTLDDLDHDGFQEVYVVTQFFWFRSWTGFNQGLNRVRDFL
jgi:hypothetical protein